MIAPLVRMPMLVGQNFVEDLALVLCVAAAAIGGKIAAVSGASIAIGERPRVAIKTGFALAQIGEFSFIMAEVGRSNAVARVRGRLQIEKD
jgi:monovalent cation:H+ antiporter-2, CPA2 family